MLHQRLVLIEDRLLLGKDVECGDLLRRSDARVALVGVTNWMSRTSSRTWLRPSRSSRRVALKAFSLSEVARTVIVPGPCSTATCCIWNTFFAMFPMSVISSLLIPPR